MLSVNVGRPRVVQGRRGAYETAIAKRPVSGPVGVTPLGLAGDAQADLRVHGGPQRAVYAYASEDYACFEELLGRSLAFGSFGENLTLAGVDASGALVGERWAVGTCEVVVTGPRLPCHKLADHLGAPGFVQVFRAAGRFGCYLAVVRPGRVAPGDPVEVLERPRDGLPVAEAAYAGARRRMH